jgi:hypothetical protein
MFEASALAEGEELGSNILHTRKQPIAEHVLVNPDYPAIAG